MTNSSQDNDRSADGATSPEIVDREAWQARIDALLIVEKAHTREGDAIAAARRRLPMVEVDANAELIGEQCEGCTFFNGQVRELAYDYLTPSPR